MLEKIKKIKNLPREKLIKISIIVGIIAIAGIFLSDSFSSNKNTQTESTAQFIDRDEYESEIEKRLEQILSEIEGIGNCKVMVTLESSAQNVYTADRESSANDAKDSSSYSDSSKHVILDDNGQQALLEKEIEPFVRGVIVVCGGADNINVKQSVIDCVSAGLGISSANISVVKGGQNE